jgi:hypothetical protein
MSHRTSAQKNCHGAVRRHRKIRASGALGACRRIRFHAIAADIADPIFAPTAPVPITRVQTAAADRKWVPASVGCPVREPEINSFFRRPTSGAVCLLRIRLFRAAGLRAPHFAAILVGRVPARRSSKRGGQFASLPSGCSLGVRKNTRS